MEVLGFILGMTGMSFGLVGMVSAMSAMEKVNAMEEQLASAGMVSESAKTKSSTNMRSSAPR